MNNKPDFKEVFPADFISEGVDQTRGWFFTLHTIKPEGAKPSDPLACPSV